VPLDREGEEDAARKRLGQPVGQAEVRVRLAQCGRNPFQQAARTIGPAT